MDSKSHIRGDLENSEISFPRTIDVSHCSDDSWLDEMATIQRNEQRAGTKSNDKGNTPSATNLNVNDTFTVDGGECRQLLDNTHNANLTKNKCNHKASAGSKQGQLQSVIGPAGDGRIGCSGHQEEDTCMKIGDQMNVDDIYAKPQKHRKWSND